jgi:hypothetical protein
MIDLAPGILVFGTTWFSGVPIDFSASTFCTLLESGDTYPYQNLGQVDNSAIRLSPPVGVS